MIRALVWICVFYLVFAHGGRVLLQLIALPALRRGLALRPFHELPAAHSGFEPPVSLIVRSGTDPARLVDSIRSLLELDYPQFEVLVVGDAGDGSLAVLQEQFQLEPFPEALWRRIPSQEVRTVYQSRLHDNLRVLDKEPGPRADAMNAGINASRYPLFCAVDPATRVQRDGLQRLAEPFLDPATVACASRIRIDGAPALPRTMLGMLQVVESLSALIFRRAGWSTLRAVVPMAGDLIVFRKDVVIEANGLRLDSECEDSELALRLHRALRGRGDRYAMRFIADPVAWREAPSSIGAIARPRLRWQHGFAASLARNRALFSGERLARGPALAIYLALEAYGPLVETGAYLFMAAMYAAGLVSGAMLAAFLALAVSLGFLVSVTALLLEVLSSDLYPGVRQLARLVLFALLENLGYRQLVTFARAFGLAPRYRPRA